MSWQWAALATLVPIALLFAFAALVEHGGTRAASRPRLRHLAYTLALGVYCSSWTFYGAVGSVVRDGWNYLPIYLAPALVLLLAPRFLGRLSRAVAEEQAKTVSDFIAARFGHDVVVARLVTVIALLGTIPYVALQLRSIGNALSLVAGAPLGVPVMIAAAAVLALFAILFGARRFELAGRSEGLVFAIGLESALKLAALVAVAGLAAVLFAYAGPARQAAGLAQIAERFDPTHLSLETLAIGVIAALAIVALPRQFYMGLVEAREPEDLVRARGGLAAYLAVMAALAIPIALAGAALFDGVVSPDVFVLELPLEAGARWALVAALLGGVGAAASMVIVDATALATMVSNDLVFPSILRAASGVGAAGGAGSGTGGSIGRRMLHVRRLSIIAIVGLALAWAVLLGRTNSLASIGHVAFAAMALFSPHLMLAAAGGGRDPLPARVSLAAGLALWLWTLALPPILPEAWLATLRGTPVDPLNLLGIGRAAPLVHGVAWSLGVDLALLGLVAARRQAGPTRLRLFAPGRPVNDVAGLHRLVADFVGTEVAEREFPVGRRGEPVDRTSAQRAQELIARVVGASSARTLVASALAGGQMRLADVARLLDEGAQSLRFSRPLLAATLENVDTAISVIDAEMNLVAWNTRYLDMFGYPPGLVRVGVPVADLIRHNAKAGDFGPEPVEHHVAKRLAHMQRGQPHEFERRRRDGRVIKTVGGPMPGGGYVMSFTDVTAEAQARDELQRTLAQLETRVADRTRELSEANRQLAEATRDKTRFLAAASHDLLQPLHAARLFAAALARDPGLTRPELVQRLDRAILGGETLLRALLDISKLDAGGVQPACSGVALAPFLADLAEGIRPLAAEKGLSVRLGPAPGSLHTDPGLLRSVLQNFLTNAVRYTNRGGVLIGVRRRGADWRIDVVDTGIGIPSERKSEVFQEFTRIGEAEAEGLGLGLAIAARIVRLLGGRIELSSVPGKGSRFSLLLPAAEDVAPPAPPAPPLRGKGRSLAVLVIDNEPEIVFATKALLEAEGHHPTGAAGMAEALSLAGPWAAVLADYHLDDGTGLALIAALRQRWPNLPAALVTAEQDRAVLAQAAEMGVPVLAKPTDPVEIAAFLSSASVRQV